MSTAMVAGLGWRQGATAGSLRAALDLALESARVHAAVASGPNMPPSPLTLLASAQDKASAPCLQALATTLGLPVCAVPLARLQAMATPTRSATVLRLRGSGSVAEAAALAAAQTTRLLQPRVVSPDRLATCALALFDPLPPPLPPPLP